MAQTTMIGGERVHAIRSAPRWIDQRLGLDELSYDVPRHANNILYVLGGITLVGILTLIASGIYLAQYYNPDPASARDSVVFIVSTVKLGAFVRSFHFWMANLVIITAMLHLVRVFVTGSYRAPREATWLTGVLLLFLLFGFAFTGTVLKWDQEGYEALGHNQDVGKLLGSTGAWFTSSFTRSVPILTRLYIAHISILPALLTLVVLAHLFLIKHHGISGLPGHEPERTDDTDTKRAIREEGASPFSAHIRLMVGFGLMLTAAAAALTLFMAAPLGQAIVQGEEVTKPTWIFVVLYPFENWVGVRALLWAPIIVALALAAVPFIDRARSSGLRARWPLLLLGLVVALAYTAFIFYGKFGPHGQHLM
ncbi:MAG: cytochrome b N-terminal domain-containing protein [Chloroflexota bacterium]|nr:cytochrome b N-terminal domain-containing protein [Chloroflexota bacterium]